MREDEEDVEDEHVEDEEDTNETINGILDLNLKESGDEEEEATEVISDDEPEIIRYLAVKLMLVQMHSLKMILEQLITF